MKGLLFKEIAMMGGQLKSWLFALGLMCVYSIFMKSNSFLYMYITLCGSMSMMSLFSIDQVCRWDSYVLCLPVARRDVVKIRYLSGFFFALFMGATGFLMVWICGILREGHLSPLDNLLRSYLVLAGTITMQSIIIPVLYRFDAEKARYICMAIFMIPVMASIYLVKWMGGRLPLEDFFHRVLLISPLMLVILVTLSFVVSVRIYRGKDM